MRFCTFVINLCVVLAWLGTLIIECVTVDIKQPGKVISPNTDSEPTRILMPLFSRDCSFLHLLALLGNSADIPVYSLYLTYRDISTTAVLAIDSIMQFYLTGRKKLQKKTTI